MHMDREKYVEMLEDYAFCKSWLAVFINEILKVHIELEQLSKHCGSIGNLKSNVRFGECCSVW